jgi:hypothetical protein
MRLATLCALFLAVLPAMAQTTFSSITGIVTDATGSVVPAARVTATHRETNIQVSTQTSDAGTYTLAQLKEGTYDLRVQVAGFKEHVAQGLALVARDLRRVDVVMEVGSVDTRIEVTAGAALIETETARIADTKDAALMKTLPLNTRSIWAILSLSPNVLQAGGGSSTIRFAGSRANQSNWAIDGVTFSDGVENTQIGPLANYIESFEEIKIDISNNTAEFGTIGQVTMISKSGTNDLHGNVFDYYSTPWFRARNPFALARGTGISHVPGGSVGGPVHLPKLYSGRNKSFFFFSFETSRGSPVVDLLNPGVPIPAWRQGDFSRLPGGSLIYDPQNSQPFPGNRLPANRINATSTKIQDRFYPLPNAGDPNVFATRNYVEQKIRPRDPSTYWTTRGDHRFSQRDSVFGRFTFQRAYNRTYEGNLPTIGRRIQQRDNRAAAISHTHTFRPTLLNEFRWGFALNNNPVAGPINGPAIVKELGLVGLANDLPDVSGILKVNWSGVGLQGITQPDYTRPGFRNHLQEFQDHVSWFRSRHNFKAGFNLARVEWDSLSANANLFGSVTFSNRFTTLNNAAQHGHPYADFLLGIPTSSARAFPPLRVDRNRWQYDLYFIDDFKVTQKLTVNLGLRYELHKGWRENNKPDVDVRHRIGQDRDRGRGVVADQPAVPAQLCRHRRGGIAGTAFAHADPERPQQLRAAHRHRVAALGRQDRAADRLRHLLRRGAAQPEPGRPPVRAERARLHQPRRESGRGAAARVPGHGFGRAIDGGHPRRREPEPQDPLFDAVQRHHRAPALGHGLPHLLCGHQHPQGRLELQLQPAAGGHAALRGQAARVPAISRHQLLHQRRWPPVPRPHAGGRAADVEWAVPAVVV